MTQRNGALVEETSASAQALADQGRQLAELVGFFKLQGGSGTAMPTVSAPAPRPTAAAAPHPVPTAKAAPAARPAVRPAAAPKPAPAAKPAAAAPPAAKPLAAADDDDWQEF
jgi:methyl-accepting chemotaxis protein